MSKRVLISSVTLLSISAIVMMFATTSCEKPTGQIPNHPGATRSYSGTGEYISESFDIYGPDWVISWDFDPDPPDNGKYVNYFGIILQKSGDSSSSNIVPRIEGTSGMRNQRVYMDEFGTFQLEIDSAGGSWQIKFTVHTDSSIPVA